MTTRSTVVVLGALLIAPPTVSAQPSGADAAMATNAEVERLHGEGVAFFKARRYREAMARFTAARGLLPDPTLTYNIGRCQEALGDLEDARRSYRTVAEDSTADVSLRAKAKARASGVDAALTAAARIAKTPAPAPPVAPRTAAVVAPGSDVPPVAAAAPRSTAPVPMPAATTPAHQNDALEWTLVGIGGAALAAGVAMTVLGLQDHGELDDAVRGGRGSLTRVRALELDSEGRDKKIWGAALSGIGLAAAGAGLVMLLVDDDPAVDGTLRTTLVPRLDRPGLAVGWEF